MSRFRLYPTPQQTAALAQHCAHARYVWNLAVEQLGYRSRGQRMPGHAEQNRQLTEARRAFDWLGAGSVEVQQQALRDFHQAMNNWRAGTHRRPTWRKRGRWLMFATRLEHKAPGRVEKVNPAFSSQRCSACGHIARESRKNQALFRCVACGHTSNADVNAACNIAAGHAVTARGGSPWGGPVNREPQHAPSQVV